MGETRAVCLNCIDGRAQLPVIHWAQQQLKVDHVDMITEPGIDGLLADQNYSMEVINWKVGISIEKNNAKTIIIAGHYDCKGNPVSEAVHKQHIQQAVKRFNKEFKDMTVVGLWVNSRFKGEAIAS